jgi:hypothetical protein
MDSGPLAQCTNQPAGRKHVKGEDDGPRAPVHVCVWGGEEGGGACVNTKHSLLYKPSSAINRRCLSKDPRVHQVQAPWVAEPLFPAGVSPRTRAAAPPPPSSSSTTGYSPRPSHPWLPRPCPFQPRPSLALSRIPRLRPTPRRRPSGGSSPSGSVSALTHSHAPVVAYLR